MLTWFTTVGTASHARSRQIGVVFFAVVSATCQTRGARCVIAIVTVCRIEGGIGACNSFFLFCTLP